MDYTAKMSKPKYFQPGHKYIDGIKTWICDERGRYFVNPKWSKPGERVKMGPKMYEIQKDFSLRRVDKPKKM